MAEPTRQEQRRQRRERMLERQQQTERGVRRRALTGRLGIGVLAGLVILGVALVVFWVAREATAPMPGVPVPNEGAEHVAVGAPLTYRSNPPSSGPHYAGTAPWSFSEAAVSPGLWVHNLEHGGIVLLYKCPQDCRELRGQLRGLYDKLRPSQLGYVKLLVAPDDAIEGRIVALAWDRRDTLESFDEDRLRRFYDAFLGRGPEPNAP